MQNSGKKSYAIDIKNADVFIDGIQILNNINWNVEYGQKCFILGTNGAGKTTLVKTILGYIWPKWGADVEILGQKFGKTDLNSLRKSIAWVSSFIHKMSGVNNGVDMVLSGEEGTLGYYKQASKEKIEEVATLLEKIGALHLANKNFDDMSSGEQVKILIARALFSKPKLMILDEPTAYLDLAQKEFLLKTVDKIVNENKDLTVIFISQNISDILPAFRTGMILKNGRIYKYGAREEILTEENLSDIYNVKVSLVKTENDRLWSIVE